MDYINAIDAICKDALILVVIVVIIGVLSGGIKITIRKDGYGQK